MRAIWIAVGMVALFTRVAAADSCEEMVAKFAQSQGLQHTPPTDHTTATTAPVAPPTLESRGLAADGIPGAEGSRVPADPLRGGGGDSAGIPTAGSVGQGTTERAPDGTESLTPATPRAGANGRTQAETLLLGATSAAREGREQECFNLFRQAREAL